MRCPEVDLQCCEIASFEGSGKMKRAKSTLKSGYWMLYRYTGYLNTDLNQTDIGNPQAGMPVPPGRHHNCSIIVCTYMDTGCWKGNHRGAEALRERGEPESQKVGRRDVRPSGVPAHRVPVVESIKHRALSVVLLLLMLISGSSYGQDVYIHPDGIYTSVGELFTVDVMVRDVTDLSAFEFCISFDKDVLEAASVAKGLLWDDPDYLWHAGEIDNTSGIIDFTSGAAYSGSSPVGVSVDANGGVLAVIAFQAISAGTSPVDLTDVHTYDVNGYEMDANAANGIVEVTHHVATTSVVLREPNSGSSTFTVSEGDTFDLQVWMDVGTEQANGVAIYLTFDDNYLQLAGDEYTDVPGIQPFEQGTFIGAGDWIVNEIDPDEPNGVSGIQLDYAEGRVSGAASGSGLVATVRFVAVAPVSSAIVSFDFDSPNARATEIGTVGPPYTITPDSHTNAQITINALPSASDLSISPASPSATDDLFGSYTYSDPEGDPEGGSEVRWYKDGVLQPDCNDTLTVPSSATSNGQAWYFTVRPSDGKGFGEVQTSDSVTINNTVPVARDLSITPVSPKPGDDLVGSYDYSDADGDPESGSEVRWYKDGVLQSDCNDTLTVPSSATSKGQVWHFTVRPSDGIDYGELQTSLTVKIENSPPLARAGGPYEGVVGAEVAFTSAGSSDPDNDTLTYVWDFDHRNGVSDVDSTEPNPKHIYTEPGVYTVTLTVNDGTVDSDPDTTTADIKVGINGFVGLQGYSNYPAAVTISLRAADTPTDLETFDVVTNDGNFTILTSMELGTYDISAKTKKYLKAIARGVAVSGGLEDVTFDPELPDIPAGEMRGGDCNGDNAVSLEDFSMLSYHYNETTDVADINGDGQVDLFDFVILGSNFGFVGVDGRTQGSPVRGDGSNRHLRFYIYLDKDTCMMHPGDEFDVHVRVDDARHLKGYSAILQYDCRVLQIVEPDGELVEEGAFLKSNSDGGSTLLISRMREDDDSAGEIMLSSCITGAGRGVSGSGVVATLRFKLMGNSPGAISIYELVVADERGKINTLPRKEFALQVPPQRTCLLMNYPNPLNPETWIPYELAEASDVRIEIYSLTGKLIRVIDLGYRQPGFYIRREDAAHWDGRNETGEEAASGVYFCTIKAGDFSATRRMAVLR